MTDDDATQVYFIVADAVRRVKIGITTDLRLRFETLQAFSPVELRVAAFMDGPLQLERSFHQKFAAYRLHGEWFRMVPALEEEIRAIQSGRWVADPHAARALSRDFATQPQKIVNWIELVFGSNWKSEAARRIGVTARTLNRWVRAAERGDCLFTRDAIAKIREASDMKTQRLTELLSRMQDGENGPQMGTAPI